MVSLSARQPPPRPRALASLAAPGLLVQRHHLGNRGLEIGHPRTVGGWVLVNSGWLAPPLALPIFCQRVIAASGL